jgi:signal transduction histidine kinase
LDCVRQIEAAAGRMAELIDALLQHARIGHDWQPRAPVDLDVVVQRALANLAAQIESSGAVIDVRPGLPVVAGYAPGLEQAFQNLIGNALKFVRPGERPVVTVGCIDEVHSCKVFIGDRGVGIDPKYRRYIFDVFRRLHGQDQYAGTGIGLAIVKKVADLHGGDVWVDSAPGRGSTFWLRLPKRMPESFEKAGPG